MKYMVIGCSLLTASACIEPPLPPEPPITMVISQCKGWDAGTPETPEDPSPKPETVPKPEAMYSRHPYRHQP